MLSLRDLALAALLGGLVEARLAQLIGQVLVEDEVPGVVVGVAIALGIALTPHQLRRGVAQRERNGQGSVFLHAFEAALIAR